MSRFQFVADHRDTFEVKRLCEVIEVDRSSFYAWDAAAPARAARAAADVALAERIRVVHEADKAYGAPRVTAELNDGTPPGKRLNHKRVARVAGPGAAATTSRRPGLFELLCELVDAGASRVDLMGCAGRPGQPGSGRTADH